MDKSWIDRPRYSIEYLNGIRAFTDFASKSSAEEGRILCPCKKCLNCHRRTCEVVVDHLIYHGFLETYTKWVCHGESLTPSFSSPHPILDKTPTQDSSTQTDLEFDPLKELLEVAFRVNNPSSIDSSLVQQDICDNMQDDSGEFEGEQGEVGTPHIDGVASASGVEHLHGADKEASNFYKLIDDANRELYPGCEKFTFLSFILTLFHIKCSGGWSGESFTALLQTLVDAFPCLGSSFPTSSYDTKKFIKMLGFGYEKIHACPNDCILYRGNRADKQSCDVCGASRWIVNSDENSNLEEIDEAEKKKKAAKILRYFPLIPRLQRLFMSSKTSPFMSWHENGRTKDGLLRHPADGMAWKAFDCRYPNFASDPRNIRLGLISDGFNPFKMMSTSYSTWPVIVFPYNVPPWLCTKQSSFILSMIIPGEKSPGNDIDVYLAPLVEELKQLWDGVETYDISSGNTFNMRAALLWTINDFPAYAMLSGWSTKGRYACPYCAEKTCSKWLYNGKKFCYLGHRRWLSETHHFRSQNQFFDGTEEKRSAPISLSGSEVLRRLDGLNFTYGKLSRNGARKFANEASYSLGKRPRYEHASNVGCQLEMGVGEEIEEDDTNDANLWKKKSIFFQLCYWEFNLLRHNLDVMHIEKNVAENLIGTLLNIVGKSKDNIMARLDLQAMGIRQELHPKVLNNKIILPPACYSMSKSEKDLFLKVLKDVKVPDGYSSNISRSINIKERKLLSLKSHDYHILMQDLLPIALRASMSKEVTAVVIELCNFFKILCSKVLSIQELQELESRAALTLCHLEKIFPPSFFTIMVHLVIHLAVEARLGGPVQYRWMYPGERFFSKLKSYCRNKAHPEGSIAEGYLAEECFSFCARYLQGVTTRFNRLSRNPEFKGMDTFLFESAGTPSGNVVIHLDDKTWQQAHRYVLLHHNLVNPIREKFLELMRRKHRPARNFDRKIHKLLNEQFPQWFKTYVSRLDDHDVSDEINILAMGPLKIAKRCTGFIFNGTRFHTKHRDKYRRTQNSGILVTSKTRSYASAKDNKPVEGDVDYYGVLTDIIELNYYGSFKVVLFRGDWAEVTTSRGIKKDSFGFILVNFSHLIHTGDDMMDEPFVFPSQVQQVFYIDDPREPDWKVALKTKPRDLFDLGMVSELDETEMRNGCMPFHHQELDESFEDYPSMPQWVRTDVIEDIYDDN